MEPLEKLRKSFEALMKGEPATIDINTGDEIGKLAQSFNLMAKELMEQKQKLQESEERYRSLVEDINEWVFELDERLVFTYSSPKVSNVLSYYPGEIIGVPVLDLLYDDKSKERLSKILDSGESTFSNVELYFRRKDGNYAILEISGRLIYKDGHLAGIRAVGREITSRKKAEEKLAYMAAIVEHSIDAIISLDMDMRIVSWNRGAEKMFGYSESEIVGKSVLSLLPVDLWDSYRESFKKAIIEGHSEDIDSVRITKNGRTIFVDQTLAPIYVDGNIVGLVAIMRDVTKRKMAEDELKKAYEKLEEKNRELIISQKELEYLANIVENSNDAIYSVNLEGIITSWNKTAEKLFGWKKEEIIGRHADSILPKEMSKETSFVIQQIKKGVENISFETRRVNRRGEVLYVDVTVSPIMDESGILSGFSVIARDITSRIRAEEEMLKKLLKYDVERGRVYLSEDVGLAIDVVQDLMNYGYRGVIISRNSDINIPADLYWLSEREGYQTVQPDVSKIESLIVGLPGWNYAIVLDLDYLIIKNGFDKTYELVQKLRDVFHLLRKGVLILVVDTNILSNKEITLLRKECSPIRAKHQKMPYEIYEVLRYVYIQNRIGEKPSLKEISQRFNITRNTCKKRVKYLEDLGLLKITKAGRSKLLEVTEKGKEYFAAVDAEMTFDEVSTDLDIIHKKV
ncbi:PAS domain S-box protein [Archaeoglobus veneficus]|uniref:PAS domain S-box protein n=1 Tax=Archaeoglobus veneficus TaxID=58290 RepID=UPI001E482E04|nr:PAS domain S-box protein [Archaeoglobus veneficus]